MAHNIGLKILNLQTINPGAVGWDGIMSDNDQSMQEFFASWEVVETVAGDALGPTQGTVTFQLQTTHGVPINITESHFLRVMCMQDNAGEPSLTDATNATISAGAGTTLARTIAAGVDLVFESDATGLVTILVDSAVAETFWLLIGPSPVSPVSGDYRNGIALDYV